MWLDNKETPAMVIQSNEKTHAIGIYSSKMIYVLVSAAIKILIFLNWEHYIDQQILTK